MKAREMDIKLTPEERLEVFGGFVPEEHAEEAEERWGDTDAYRQFQQRVSNYTKEDWLKIKAEHEEIAGNLAALFKSRTAPDGEDAIAAAEAHRQHISRWYYDCIHEMHRFTKKTTEANHATYRRSQAWQKPTRKFHAALQPENMQPE